MSDDVLDLAVDKEEFPGGERVSEYSAHAEGGQDALEPVPAACDYEFPGAEEEGGAVRGLESYGDCREPLAIVEAVWEE